MFEAGATSKVIDKARVCPIAFDIELTDIQGPLAQFQATRFTEDDFRQLVLTVNSAAGEQRLSDSTAQKVFEKWWPDLQAQLRSILEKDKTSGKPSGELRKDRDILDEALLLIRNLATGQRNLEENMNQLREAVSLSMPLSTVGTNYAESLQRFLPPMTPPQATDDIDLARLIEESEELGRFLAKDDLMKRRLMKRREELQRRISELRAAKAEKAQKGDDN